MIIFRDILLIPTDDLIVDTGFDRVGAEVLSDAFQMTDLATGKRIFFEGTSIQELGVAIAKVASRKAVPNDSGEIDIGCGNAFGGSNDEEEDAAAASNPDAPQPVIDVVHNGKLQLIEGLSVAAWKGHFMVWAKALKAKCEEIDAKKGNSAFTDSFKKNFPAIKEFCTGEVVTNFKEYEFYLPADGELGSACLPIPAKYEGEAISPDFYFFLNGLNSRKF